MGFAFVIMLLPLPSFAAPDLIPLPYSISTTIMVMDQSFTFDVYVRNLGDTRSDNTLLRYYYSTNDTISTGDTPLPGMIDTVVSLGPGSMTDETGRVSAPPAAGTYWVGACVDVVQDEEVTNNNCSSGTQILVIDGPDLTAIAPSVDNANLMFGQDFTITATARNIGTQTSAATTMQFYRSDNPTITTGDFLMSARTVSPLAPGGNDTVVSLSLPAPFDLNPATYWVGACLVVSAGEIIDNNQCTTGVEITVLPPQPDLRLIFPAVSDRLLEQGQSYDINMLVENQGTVSSGNTDIHYYRSDNHIITTLDTEIASTPVLSLAGGAFQAQSVSVTIPANLELGFHWIGACIDAVTNESITDNQCSDAIQITVGPPSFPWGMFLPAILNNVTH